MGGEWKGEEVLWMLSLVEADRGGTGDMDEGYKSFSVSGLCLGFSPALSRMHFCKPVHS